MRVNCFEGNYSRSAQQIVQLKKRKIATLAMGIDRLAEYSCARSIFRCFENRHRERERERKYGNSHSLKTLTTNWLKCLYIANATRNPYWKCGCCQRNLMQHRMIHHDYVDDDDDVNEYCVRVGNNKRLLVCDGNFYRLLPLFYFFLLAVLIDASSITICCVLCMHGHPFQRKQPQLRFLFCQTNICFLARFFVRPSIRSHRIVSCRVTRRDNVKPISVHPKWLKFARAIGLMHFDSRDRASFGRG